MEADMKIVESDMAGGFASRCQKPVITTKKNACRAVAFIQIHYGEAKQCAQVDIWEEKELTLLKETSHFQSWTVAAGLEFLSISLSLNYLQLAVIVDS